MDQFEEMFQTILSKIEKPSESGAAEMGSLLQKFDSDEFKIKAIGMSVTLQEKMRECGTIINQDLFDVFAHMYCENQQWNELETLVETANHTNTKI